MKFKLWNLALVGYFQVSVSGKPSKIEDIGQYTIRSIVQSIYGKHQQNCNRNDFLVVNMFLNNILKVYQNLPGATSRKTGFKNYRTWCYLNCAERPPNFQRGIIERGRKYFSTREHLKERIKGMYFSYLLNTI